MKKVRFGLIGYGAWGSHHAAALAGNPGAELAAIAVLSEKSQALARTAHPAVEVTGDYRALLRRSDIEAVVVVLPSDLHYEVARAVLEAGKHLLLEKPMTLSVRHCDELNQLARDKGLLLAIGHELRLSSLWGKVKEMIAADQIGEPRYVLVELWRKPYRQGSAGWRYDPKRVGSWILEEPIHFFDFARWYLQGFGAPVSIFARSSSQQPSHPERQDNFSALLNFSNGAYAVISQTLSAYEHHQVVKVTGTKGALWATWSGAMDRTLHPSFSLKHFDGATIHEVPITKITGEVYELQDQVELMVRAIRDGGPLNATGEDGRWSVALCLAAQQSIETGAVVDVRQSPGA